MRSWPQATVRVFSIVNVALGLLGLSFLSVGFLRYSDRVLPKEGEPYVVQAFYLMTAVNLVLLLVLLFAAVYVWRLQPRGLVICNVLFSVEIVYWITLSLAELYLVLSGSQTHKLIGMSMAAAHGIGNIGVSAQFLIGYPLVAIIALNIAYRRLGRTVSNAPSGTPESSG